MLLNRLPCQRERERERELVVAGLFILNMLNHGLKSVYISDITENKIHGACTCTSADDEPDKRC